MDDRAPNQPPVQSPNLEESGLGPSLDATCDASLSDTGNAAVPTDAPPVHFSQYEVVRELGRGGMGVVLLARQRSLNRLVAIKMILAGRLATSQVRERFLREAEVLARLQHPNIVRVYDLGEEAGQAYFVMEYVDGTDLTHSSPLPPRRAAELVETIARAIHAAHQQGVIHRDLKPANVLLGEDGVPKVTDFGLARFLDQEAAGHPLTLDEQLLGTAPYMAPEQAAGDTPKIGPAADIYGLGAVLYHVLSGQAPFLGKSTLEVLKRVQTEEPWPLSQLTSGVPRDLDTICLKCLDKEPSRRYSTADDLADDLRRFLRGEPIQARPISGIHRAIRVVRRSSLLQVTAVVLALALGFGALRAREYYLNERPVEQHFGQVLLTRDGVMGLKPLDRSTKAKRSDVLLLERRGLRGPVVAVTAINSAGHPIAHPSLSPIGDSNRADPSVAKLEFTYDASGAVSKIKALDLAGQDRWSFIFTDPPRTGYYVDSRGYEQAPRGTGAAYLEFDFTDEGLIEGIRFYDRRGRPQPDADGAYALRIQHDDRRRVTNVSYLDAKGQPTLVDGYCHTLIDWDDDDQMRTITHLNEDGNPTYCVEGYVSRTLDYDAAGNITEIANCGLRGEPVVSTDGFARRKSTFNDAGFETIAIFLDTEGNAIASNSGVAEVHYEHNEKGQVIRETNFDPQGAPIAGQNGYARVDRVFDEKGYVIEESVFDVVGEPSLDADGVFRSVYRYDNRGNQIEVAEFNAAGEPILNTRGWHRLQAVYDRQDNQIELHYQDEHGRSAVHSDGMASILQEFDDRGNVERKIYLGPDGQRDETAMGYAEERSRYNERGMPIEEAVFDRSGNPTITNDGWHRTEVQYDDRGYEIERRFLGVDGRPTWHKNGYSVQRNTVDDRGNDIEELFLDPDGQPTMTMYGFARMVADYDNRGNVMEARFFDRQDRPVGPLGPYLDEYSEGQFAGLAGVHRLVTEYDHQGNLTRMRFFGVHQGPLALANGIAGADFAFDHRGLQTRAAFVGIDEMPLEIFGVASRETKYDAHGHPIDVRTFDAEGGPVCDSDGYHQIVNTYDQRGNRTEFRLYDEHGNPVAHSEGHSWLQREYDSRGNLIKESLYDVNDRPVVGERGYATFTAEYDRFGNRVEEAYFDAQGQPFLGNEGYHRFRSRFERGKVVETSYFGVDGEPIRSVHGSARLENRYDDRMNLVEAATFDVDGHPIPVHGYARVTYEHDGRGNVVRAAFWDADGKLTLQDGGYAIVALSYDEFGRRNGSATYGTDEEPVLRNELGYFRESIKFDPWGQEIQRQYFGVGNQPVVAAEGFAETTTQYDDHGVARARQYYDANGERLTVQVAVNEVDSDGDSDDTTLYVGDVILRVDDEPVSDALQLAYRLDKGATGPRPFAVLRKDQKLELQVPEEVYESIEFQDVLPGQPLPKPPGLLDRIRSLMQE